MYSPLELRVRMPKTTQKMRLVGFSTGRVLDLPTDRITDAVAKTLRMQHVVFRIKHIVTNKLHRLSIHNWQMLILNHGIGKMLMHEFTKCSPLGAVMHHE